MTSCEIRYRLEGSGPSTLLVNCDGEVRMHTSDRIANHAHRSRLLALLAESELRWIPASGSVDIEPEPRPNQAALSPAERPVVRTIPA